MPLNQTNQKFRLSEWALLGSNQRPPDYESDALTGWAKGPSADEQEKAPRLNETRNFQVQGPIGRSEAKLRTGA